MTQIPIYRAKCLDTGEWVEGLLGFSPYCENHHWYITLNDRHDFNPYEIDHSTLAIHFPGIFDYNGNKVWASLNERGVGGSVLFSSMKTLFIDGAIVLQNINDKSATVGGFFNPKSIMKDYIITGIYEG